MRRIAALLITCLALAALAAPLLAGCKSKTSAAQGETTGKTGMKIADKKPPLAPSAPK